MESMKRLSEHLANRPAQLMEQKKQGVKIIGYFPGGYVPEEITSYSKESYDYGLKPQT